jgi:hypothetical protein
MARQFLVSVSSSPEGYEARVQTAEPIARIVRKPFALVETNGRVGRGPEFTGQGATATAACLAALAQAHLGQPIPGPSKPPEVSRNGC